MAVLERSELQDSPLADLHAIADQLGLEGFRRLRKAQLIDAILGQSPGGGDDAAGDAPADREPPAAGESLQQTPSAGGERRRRLSRGRRLRRAQAGEDSDDESRPSAESERSSSGQGDGSGPESEGERDAKRDAERGDRPEREDDPEREGRPRRESRAGRRPEDERSTGEGLAEGVVELLGNGSAFLRVKPPEASDEDVYISAAQVRRCELVSGDRVTGPMRMPRRSERYPSLVRVETINEAPAGEVSEGARYEDRPVAYASERLALNGGDRTLDAIEWLTPFGRGSRAVIAGPARAGKTEILRRLLGALAGREGLEVTLVLAGVRPEEIAEWAEGPVTPATALGFAASADAQSQAVERALETAKRTAARGGDALVLIDTLDGLHPHVARKVLAAARNLRDGGSLTILATATSPLGGETTVVALDPALAGGDGPPLDLTSSGTLRAELLVGEEGATAIARARASALESSG
jgi:transcription termination factor Rho